MRERKLTFDESSIILPRGTRVVLRVDMSGPDGYVHRAASGAVVREVDNNTYTLETPAGRRFVAPRDQITVPRRDALDALGVAQWDHRRLRGHTIYSAVVGSRAWGLAGPDSDFDVRGCFVAPFELRAGLWRVPDEIHDPGHEEALWELSKFVSQALRGDANTLETLWSPLHRVVTPLGARLLERREIFVSMNVLGSFGRYAQSQFDKIERSRARGQALAALLDAAQAGQVSDEADALRVLGEAAGGAPKAALRAELKASLRSLADRGLLGAPGLEALLSAVAEGRRAELMPGPHRPKNAYNLLRLLHSCLHWLRFSEPLIEVQGDLRQTLLGIKSQSTPIEQTLALARAAAQEVEAAAMQSKLPEAPDYEGADALLRELRRAVARVSAPAPAPPASEIPGPLAAQRWFARRELPVPLPPDVHVDVLRRFLAPRLEVGPPVIALALTGAHAYGFPSPDSDLDLKGVHVTGAADLLGLGPAPGAVDEIEDFEGREHDYTSNDLGRAAELLLGGNANFLERFLGPFPLLETAAGRRMAELAQASLSRRCYRPYRGFMKGVLREYDREKAQGARKAKRLLYGFRTGLTGLHLLRAGEMITDVNRLAPEYGFEAEVRALAQIKARAEYAQVEEDAGYLEALERLARELHAAHEASALPEDPPNADAVSDFVVELRLAVAPPRRRVQT